MQKIKTYLWFDNNAEEAVNYYISIFKQGKVESATRWPKGHPQEGQLLVMEFSLFGQQYVALNGGPQFKFNEAISLMVICEDQAEVDHYWTNLTSNGGEESMCGWLKDRFGLSWQITPKQLMAAISDKDQAKAGRAMEAMMKMKKIDVRKIQEAFDGK